MARSSALHARKNGDAFSTIQHASTGGIGGAAVDCASLVVSDDGVGGQNVAWRSSLSVCAESARSERLLTIIGQTAAVPSRSVDRWQEVTKLRTEHERERANPRTADRMTR